MQDLLNFTKYKAILCLNGELPKKSFFLKSNLPIVAADGAANQLFALGVAPHLIIGDLDSVAPNLLQKYPYIHLASQENNDYQKGLNYLKEQNLLPAIIVGISGGALDHILNNINIFIQSDLLLYAPPIKGFMINEKSKKQLSLPIETKISILAIPKANISTQGLKWELNHDDLAFPGQNSCYNRTELPEITLEIHHGSALVLIYENPVEDAGML